MFKYDLCVHETGGYHFPYPGIYLGNYAHFGYPRRVFYCTLTLFRHSIKKDVPMDSIIPGYYLVNFDDFSITGFLVPTGHYTQKIGLIDLFKEHLKIKMKTVHHNAPQ